MPCTITQVYFFHTMALLCTIVIVIAGCLHFMPSIFLAREEKEILEYRVLYRHLLCFFLQTIYHSFWQVQKLNWSCNKRKRQATKKNSAKKLNFKIMWSTEIRTVVFHFTLFLKHGSIAKPRQSREKCFSYTLL